MTVTDAIEPGQDYIDSRDIIARIEFLQDTDDEDEQEELAALVALAKEAEPYSEDWEYGATLIEDSEFVTYAQTLAEDIGAIDPNANWPLCHIDWNAAAESLKQDYVAVEFGDFRYWVR